MPKPLARQSSSQLREVVKARMQTVVTSKREQNAVSEIAKEVGLGMATVKIKDGLYDVLPRFKSDCCNAPLMAGGCGVMERRYYICHKCRKPCGAV